LLLVPRSGRGCRRRQRFWTVAVRSPSFIPPGSAADYLIGSAQYDQRRTRPSRPGPTSGSALAWFFPAGLWVFCARDSGRNAIGRRGVRSGVRTRCLAARRRRPSPRSRPVGLSRRTEPRPAPPGSRTGTGGCDLDEPPGGEVLFERGRFQRRGDDPDHLPTERSCGFYHSGRLRCRHRRRSTLRPRSGRVSRKPGSVPASADPRLFGTGLRCTGPSLFAPAGQGGDDESVMPSLEPRLLYLDPCRFRLAFEI